MLMGQSDEGAAVARQAKLDAESAGDEALLVEFPHILAITFQAIGADTFVILLFDDTNADVVLFQKRAEKVLADLSAMNHDV
jgi:hypothetical protein